MIAAQLYTQRERLSFPDAPIGLFLLGTPAFNITGSWERSWTWYRFLGRSQAPLLECAPLQDVQTVRFPFPHLNMVKQMLVFSAAFRPLLPHMSYSDCPVLLHSQA